MLDDLMLGTLWDSYKTQVWWKKLLTFVPFILLFVIVGVIVFFIRNNKEVPSTNFETKEIKDKLEESIEQSEETIKKSEQEYKELEKKENNILQEYKKDEENISSNGGDFDKLERIAAELRARNAARRR
jgi:low affinity Fe/Cu permease